MHLSAFICYCSIIYHRSIQIVLIALETTEELTATSLEVEGVSAAEKGDLALALELLNKAVQTSPQKASCYNNRAQALQIAGNTDGH